MLIMIIIILTVCPMQNSSGFILYIIITTKSLAYGIVVLVITTIHC